MPKRKALLYLVCIVAVAAAISILFLLRSGTPSAVINETQEEPEEAVVTAQTEGESSTEISNTVDETAVTVPTDFQELSEEAIATSFKQATQLLDNPVHPGRRHLQEQMLEETPQETFIHLADNDNLAMVMPLMAGQPFSPGNYRSDIRAMCQMTRVRKLLEDTRKNPETMVPFLQEQLLSIADRFPKMFHDFEEEMKNDQVEGMHKFKKLPDLFKNRLLSTAAVYVLSDVNATEALPVLATLSTIGEPRGSYDLSNTGPVNRKFLLFAMHKLIKEYPTASLSVEGEATRRSYLSMASRMNIPDGKQIQVTSWNATYHENDYRRTTLRRDLWFDKQSTIELEQFPTLDQLNPREVEKLLMRIREFVQLSANGG